MSSGQAVVLVHGFNVSFVDAVLQAAVFALDLKFGGPVIIFSWASDGNVYRYSTDEETIQLSEEHFADLVGKFLSLEDLERLYIVSHSMGSRLVVESLTTLILERQPGRVGVLELVFGAPDMNSKLFSMRMEKIAGVPARVTLYASDNDMALHCARLVHGDYDRAGQEGEAVVIMPGVETVDTTELIPASQRAKYKQCISGVMLAELSLAAEDFEHSYLFNDQRVIGDLAGLIQNDRGAEARFRLEKVDTAKGSFHRMRP
jgi:esterase/lipase superfamily enzyme